MNIDVNTLAAELATVELDRKIDAGEEKYNDVWVKYVEEFHGEHIHYELSNYGEKLYGIICNRMLGIILKHEK